MDSKLIWSIGVGGPSCAFAFCHASLSLLGYIDDVRNTDNAWVEAEIWNFHYGATMAFPNLRTDVSDPMAACESSHET